MPDKTGNDGIILRCIRRVWNDRNMAREEVVDPKAIFGNNREKP